MTRSSQASYSQQVIGENFDNQCSVFSNSTAHTYGDCKEDVKDIMKSLRNLRPFTFTAERSHKAFPQMSKSPLDQLDPVLLDQWLTRNKRKVATLEDDENNEDDTTAVVNDNEDDDEDGDEDNDEDNDDTCSCSSEGIFLDDNNSGSD